MGRSGAPAPGACVSASTTTFTPSSCPIPGGCRPRAGTDAAASPLRKLAEVEPGALVVGAVGGEAVRLAPRLGRRATRRRHPADRLLQVGDPPHRHGGGLGVAAGNADHGRGAHYLPAVGDASGGELPAEHGAVEVAGPARVHDLEGDVGDIPVARRGCPPAGARSPRAPGSTARGNAARGSRAGAGPAADRRGLVHREPGALVVLAVGALAVRPGDGVAGLASGRPYPRHRQRGVIHNVGAEQRGPGLAAPQALWRRGGWYLPAARFLRWGVLPAEHGGVELRGAVDVRHPERRVPDVALPRPPRATG